MKILKITLYVLFIYLFTSSVYASTLDNIEVVDDKNITLTLSEDATLLEWDNSPQVKVLKDIEIHLVSKDIQDQNKLILSLSWALQENKRYSLLTILWPEGSIDFALKDILENKEIINDIKAEWQWINRMVIKNSKTIELYFNNIIAEKEFELKLLNEVKISQIKAGNTNKITLSLSDILEKSSDYIIMLLSVKDSLWKELTFEEELYDFTTALDLKSTQWAVESWTWSVVKDVSPEKWWEEEGVWSTKDIPSEEWWEAEGIWDTKNTPMEKWWEEIKTENTKKESLEEWKKGEKWEKEEWTLEEVALNAAQTPDTWASTWILLILTFTISSIVFYRKKLLRI
jgi:hypothetical protein